MRTTTTTADTGRDTAGNVRTITGVVKSTDGTTLPGAHVYYINDAGNATGEATDINGAFSFVAPIGATVRATFVGYAPQEKTVQAGAAPLVFELAPGVDLPTFEVVGDAPSGTGTAAAVGAGLLLLLLFAGDR